MNISYKTPLQEAISIPVQALAILEDLDAHIKKHRAVFHLSGLQPSISLDSQTSTMVSDLFHHSCPRGESMIYVGFLESFVFMLEVMLQNLRGIHI